MVHAGRQAGDEQVGDEQVGDDQVGEERDNNHGDDDCAIHSTSCTSLRYNIIINIIFTIMHKVDGVVVINNEGIPIKSTLDSTSTVQVILTD